MSKKRFVILIGIFFIVIFSILLITAMSIFSPPKIVSFSPANNSQNNSIYVPISIIFNKSLSSKDLASISLTTSPKIEGTLTRSQDNKIIYLTPTTPLAFNQSYNVIFNLDSDKLTWSFQTVSIENESPQDQAKAQTQADANFNKLVKDLYSQYPWYKNLPLQTKVYFVYFDTDKKIFNATIYASKQGFASSQIQGQKDEILASLKDLGVDTNQYQINWTIK